MRSSCQRLLLAKVSTFNFKEFKSETNHSGANTNASQIYVSFVQKNSIALHLKIFCQNCCCNVMPFAKNEIWNVFGNQKGETWKNKQQIFKKLLRPKTLIEAVEKKIFKKFWRPKSWVSLPAILMSPSGHKLRQ